MKRVVRSILGFLLVAGATPAGAQTVTGVVRDSATHGPMAGTLVFVADSLNVVLCRTVTNASGAFRLCAPGGRGSVTARRIGYRPRKLSLIGSEWDKPVDLEMAPVPTLLEPMQVLGQSRCQAKADVIPALALWEHAEAELLSVIVTREANPAFVRRLSFQRVVGDAPDGVLTQSVGEDSATVTRPFAASRSAADFVDRGFRDMVNGRVSYHGPDADVLVDPAFFNAYCFGLAHEPPKGETWVGLTFEPNSRREGRIDVRGVVWIDTTSRQVRRIDFRFVGLQRKEERAEPGGQVDFAVSRSGIPFISSWMIRNAAPPNPQRFVSALVTAQTIEVHEAGGIVARADWKDGASWKAELPSIEGRLLADKRPVGGVTVRLVASPYSAVTDSTGRFVIDDVLPGRYVLSVADASLNALGFELTRGDAVVVSPGRPSRVEMEMPTPRDFVRAKCGARTRASRVVVGRVTGSDGLRALGAELHGFEAKLPPGAADAGLSAMDLRDLEWSRAFDGTTGTSDRFFAATNGVEGAQGAFVMCGVEGAYVYRIQARQGTEAVESVVTTLPADAAIFTANLILRPSPDAARSKPPLH